MKFESKYDLGQTVYLVTDPEQLPRMVVAVLFTADGGIHYTLSLADTLSDHYEVELSTSVNHVQRLGIKSN